MRMGRVRTDGRSAAISGAEGLLFSIVRRLCLARTLPTRTPMGTPCKRGLAARAALVLSALSTFGCGSTEARSKSGTDAGAGGAAHVATGAGGDAGLNLTSDGSGRV